MSFAVAEYSKGKHLDHNEDKIAHDDTTFVIADGATDKSGALYDGYTSGELAAEITVTTCLGSNNTGVRLVQEITNTIETYYKKYVGEKQNSGYYRFGASFTCAKIIGEFLVITSVGDTGWRINGSHPHENRKKVDILTAHSRKQYIELTGDTTNSRTFIMPLLKNQYIYQNNPDHPLGYGFLDGTPVPEKYIHIERHKISDIQTLEIFSDGYLGQCPTGTYINEREDMYQKMDKEDPHKYLTYPATKPQDDRSIMIVKFIHDDIV